MSDTEEQPPEEEPQPEEEEPQPEEEEEPQPEAEEEPQPEEEGPPVDKDGNPIEEQNQWPDVVGKEAEDAKAVIEGERPELNVMIMDQYKPCTRDYRENRVRIFVDKDGYVVRAPFVG